jgi:hypothetical protein
MAIHDQSASAIIPGPLRNLARRQDDSRKQVAMFVRFRIHNPARRPAGADDVSARRRRTSPYPHSGLSESILDKLPRMSATLAIHYTRRTELPLYQAGKGPQHETACSFHPNAKRIRDASRHEMAQDFA